MNESGSDLTALKGASMTTPSYKEKKTDSAVDVFICCGSYSRMSSLTCPHDNTNFPAANQ